MGDDTTADCVVVVDGDREYPCHKCILATASAVFRNLLYSQGVKQWESRIKLDGVSVAGWDTLHNYCYKQSVPTTLDAALEAVKVAHQYDVSQLLISAAAADSSKRWVAAYTRGLQDVLHMHINNGEARLRPGNVRRGGSGEHILVVASTVATGSGVQVSAPLLVGAHLWQLSVDGGGAVNAPQRKALSTGTRLARSAANR